MAMPSVIPQTPGIGEKMGEAFGGGLSSGLQALANLKLQQLQQRQQATQTEQALAGYLPPEEARMVSHMPPQLQGIYFKDKLTRARDQDLFSLLSSEANNQPIDQMARSEMQQGQQFPMGQGIQQGFWNLFPQQQVNQAMQDRVQAVQTPEVTPTKLRALADRIELLDPKRFAARVSDLRKRARTMEAEEIQARGEKRRKSLKTKKLTDAARMQFLIEASGDIEKAKQLAAQAGYEE